MSKASKRDAEGKIPRITKRCRVALQEIEHRLQGKGKKQPLRKVPA